MSIYFMIDFIIVVLYVLLAYFTVTSKNTKSRQGLIFVGLTVSFLSWMIANHLSNDVSVSMDIALVATRILFVASFLATVFLLLMVSEIIDKKIFSLKRGGVFLVAIMAVLFASPLTAANIFRNGKVYGVEFGPLGVVYGITVALLVIIMLIFISRNWNNKNKHIRRQIHSVGAGIIFTAPTILLLAYVIPNVTGSFEISQVALAPSIILLATIYYATIKHGLFDLRSVAIRTMTYVLTLSVLTSVYFILAYIMSAVLFKGQASTNGLSISPLNVLLALVMAVIFQPIKQLFDKLTNGIFYRGAYDQEKFLKEFSHILSYNTNINLLIDRASQYITENLKASSIGFYIHDRDLARSRGDGSLRLSANTLSAIEGATPDTKETIILTDNLEVGRLSKILLHHHIKIMIPMRLNDKIIGYMFLGEHKNGSYDTRDIRLLESIINELAIAIQNSLSVEVIRDLNENLQQKVDDATRELRRSNEKLKELDKTKDEFLSIASHQLRTPLTSIKGYIDMLREGDFGEVNEAQKSALDETFSSSERMVRLINDFLNVSRLQTGKFSIDKRPTDLSELIYQEVSMLDLVAKQSDIKFELKIDEVKDIKIDAEKIRQVVLNMLDNAIFYSQQNSTIKVQLKHDKDRVIFTVKDTGIGVPEKDQEKLFGKFFRATNARRRRPDGTGVGLFLSKKVISGHRGEIIFHSKEGEGSIFGFSLPL